MISKRMATVGLIFVGSEVAHLIPCRVTGLQTIREFPDLGIRGRFVMSASIPSSNLEHLGVVLPHVLVGKKIRAFCLEWPASSWPKLTEATKLDSNWLKSGEKWLNGPREGRENRLKSTKIGPEDLTRKVEQNNT